MNRITSLILSFAFCITCVGPSMAMPTPSPAQVALPTSPWSPLISFVGSLLSLIIGNGKTKQQAKTLQPTAQQMDQAQKVLQAWPKLMEDSRGLRQDAIALAQLIDFARKDSSLADKNWVAVTLGIKNVKAEYQAIYGKSAYTDLLASYSGYQGTFDGARRMWNAIEVDLGQPSNSAADRMNILQAVHDETIKADILLNVAFLPEYWAKSEADYLVERYKSLAGDAKTATGAPSTTPGTGNNGTGSGSVSSSTPQAAYPEFRHKPMLTRTDFHELSVDAKRPQEFTPASVSDPQEEAGSKSPAQEISSYGKAPEWMTTTVTLTRSQYKVDWRNTLLAGLMGAGVGFIALMFLPALARTYAPPRGQPQLDLLTRSLAFRANAADQFSSELGALHLDVLSYLFDAKMPQVAGIAELRSKDNDVYARIRDLRAALRAGKI